MEKGRRFILFLAAAVITSPLFIKGHGPSRKGDSVAFLPYTSSGVTIRLKGMIPSQGVYAFCKGTTIASVINMTGVVTPTAEIDRGVLDTQLKSGDMVEIVSQVSDLRMKTINARERMLLGIPLAPDRMDLDDWASLPGVGPVLAKRIFYDRQNNGEFCTVESLRRVPGIGKKTYASLLKYF